MHRAFDVVTDGRSIISSTPILAAPRAHDCRDLSRATGLTDPNALLTLGQLIHAVFAVEQKLNESRSKVITRMRQTYYCGLLFDQLLPDAASWHPSTSSTIGRRMVPQGIGDDHYTRLTARADELARGDNPSPYLSFKTKGTLRQSTSTSGTCYLASTPSLTTGSDILTRASEFVPSTLLRGQLTLAWPLRG